MPQAACAAPEWADLQTHEEAGAGQLHVCPPGGGVCSWLQPVLHAAVKVQQAAHASAHCRHFFLTQEPAASPQSEQLECAASKWAHPQLHEANNIGKARQWAVAVLLATGCAICI
eukprot:1146793-Pelagomonas_calceolata.AAC.7